MKQSSANPVVDVGRVTKLQISLYAFRRLPQQHDVSEPCVWIVRIHQLQEAVDLVRRSARAPCTANRDTDEGSHAAG